MCVIFFFQRKPNELRFIEKSEIPTLENLCINIASKHNAILLLIFPVFSLIQTSSTKLSLNLCNLQYFKPSVFFAKIFIFFYYSYDGNTNDEKPSEMRLIKCVALFSSFILKQSCARFMTIEKQSTIRPLSRTLCNDN